jgi:ATP-dependent Lhr-like helicase
MRRHQAQMLEQVGAGRHVLLAADTGAGKTLAGFLPTLCDAARAIGDGLHTLYVSPLKALAHDVRRGLMAPVEDLGLACGSRRARRYILRPQGAAAA